MASNGSDRGKRPLIGITSYLERARFGIWEADCALLTRDYSDMVARAGGVPVLLPPIGDGYAEIVARIDGLLLSGGGDVDPARYAEPDDPRTAGVQQGRDAFEFGLLDAALAAGVPVLGICRGLQVLNAALGGTLHQHLPDHNGNEGHRPVPGTFGTTTVRTAPDTMADRVLGESTTVRCHHHQAIAKLAPTLTATAFADDGTIEAVEGTGAAFVLGVQWHPEQDAGDDRVVTLLVDVARGRAAR